MVTQQFCLHSPLLVTRDRMDNTEHWNEPGN